MSDPSIACGHIGWIDLTVPDADRLRDFYSEVVGWRPDPVDMGGYSDYQMLRPSTGEPVAGVCHAHGVNADLPPVWLIYIVVPNLTDTLARCTSHGGMRQARAERGQRSRLPTRLDLVAGSPRHRDDRAPRRIRARRSAVSSARAALTSRCTPPSRARDSVPGLGRPARQPSGLSDCTT